MKKALREQLLKMLRQQPRRLRLAKSTRIAKRLRRLSVYRRAKNILCYVAFDGEVETLPILREACADGKKVAVPVVRPGSKRLVAALVGDPDCDLKRKGLLGIPEPEKVRSVPSTRLDLVLVPAVAFDKKGGRLGRGGGYFDRFLERLPKRIPRIGLAFGFQVVAKLPIESHDQPVNRLVTEEKVIRGKS